ncbi:MAG TPA: hypothetical protein VGE93_06390 [Bryobacteraceae bacterium]
MSDTPNPLEALMKMGFRQSVPDMPHADTLGGVDPMAMAVNMLSGVLTGENAAGMAEFIQLAVRAVARNGYGLTYAVGPAGEFGILVVPIDLETGAPDMERAKGDYCLAAQFGDVEQVLQTIQAANPIPRQVSSDETPVPSRASTD